MYIFFDLIFYFRKFFYRYIYIFIKLGIYKIMYYNIVYFKKKIENNLILCSFKKENVLIRKDF